MAKAENITLFFTGGVVIYILKDDDVVSTDPKLNKDKVRELYDLLLGNGMCGYLRVDYSLWDNDNIIAIKVDMLDNEDTVTVTYKKYDIRDAHEKCVTDIRGVFERSTELTSKKEYMDMVRPILNGFKRLGVVDEEYDTPKGGFTTTGVPYVFW